MSGGLEMNIDSQMSSVYYTGFTTPQILFILILCIISYAAMWVLYKKGGKKGWEAIVPFYTDYVMCDMAYGNGWIFLIGLIPVARIIFAWYTLYRFAKLYKGCGTGMALGCAFIPFIFLPILAWGKGYDYVGRENF